MSEMRAGPSGLVSLEAAADAGATPAANARRQPKRAAFMAAKICYFLTVCLHVQGQQGK